VFRRGPRGEVLRLGAQTASTKGGRHPRLITASKLSFGTRGDHNIGIGLHVSGCWTMTTVIAGRE